MGDKRRDWSCRSSLKSVPTRALGHDWPLACLSSRLTKQKTMPYAIHQDQLITVR